MKKLLVYIAYAILILIVVSFWWFNSGSGILDGNRTSVIVLGRLFGLLAVVAVLTQFFLMGRIGWFEPIFGMDKIARYHRWNGFIALGLIVSHVTFIVGGYSIISQKNPLNQYIDLIVHFPYVWMASISVLLFFVIVGFSLFIVRKHLKFETWYFIHLLVYLAVALVPFHQLAVGGDFIRSPEFGYFWIALYIFVALNVIGWRFTKPLFDFWRQKFTVTEVVNEAPRATSVYITGKNLEKFVSRAKAGQFVLVRFLTKDLWWQEHPFSLSQLPKKDKFRLTIRQLGDFTNQIPNLSPGTKVIISGPHGGFTNKNLSNKKLFIAGGVGITPIRSLIEEESKNSDSDSILIYGNRILEEVIFKNELLQFTNKMKLQLHNVLSDEPNYSGETGFIDKEKIQRLVPDLPERDIYLCGPPPMMNAITKALKELGVSKKQLHYERFSLHVK